MYRAIEAFGQKHRFEGPVLSISHSRHLLPLLKVENAVVTDANYPEINILNLPFPDESFNLVVSDQVFEHIKGLPSDAFRETMRVLKPGGWALHTTCFLTPYHGPGDYWRFSPEGLRELALNSGGGEVYAGGHGHPLELIVNVLDWRRLHVPAASWHPLQKLAAMNRDSYHTNVWVLVRKPA
ncbi:MAG: class I SAM-dependent methyltransferase [Bryobacteraceae bacterium]|nr:class I SAM-dependent methyltransferase [Bryobacteraceae bacterium]